MHLPSAAATAALLALGAVPALAAPTRAAPPSPTAGRPAQVEAAHPAALALVGAMMPALETYIAQQGDVHLDSMPPEWRPHFTAAVLEEMKASGVAFIAVGLQKHFTTPELDAGARLFASPTGSRLLTEAVAGRDVSSSSSSEADKIFFLDWIGTPGAGTFLSKVGKMKHDQFVDGPAFMQAMMPGVLRRFADKIGPAK